MKRLTWDQITRGLMLPAGLAIGTGITVLFGATPGWVAGVGLMFCGVLVAEGPRMVARRLLGSVAAESLYGVVRDVAAAAIAAERERIARLADAEAAAGAKSGLDRIALRAFAERLRQEPPPPSENGLAAGGPVNPHG